MINKILLAFIHHKIYNIISNSIVFLEDVPRVFNKELLGCLFNVLLKTVGRYIVAEGLLHPLEVKLEVVSNVLLNVKFINCQAVSDVKGRLR